MTRLLLNAGRQMPKVMPTQTCNTPLKHTHNKFLEPQQGLQSRGSPRATVGKDINKRKLISVEAGLNLSVEPNVSCGTWEAGTATK